MPAENIDWAVIWMSLVVFLPSAFALVLLLLLGSAKVASADDSRDVAREHYARGLELAGHAGYQAALQ